MSEQSRWQYYYPDDGESAEDAKTMPKGSTVWSPQCVADYAADFDYNERDGWERGQCEIYRIVVISPEGEETSFSAHWYLDVRHYVSANS